MRPKVLKWEVIILCVVLFFPGISLNAQEVRQDDIYEIRQSSFSRYGFDTLSVHTPHRFIHRLGVEVRPQYVFPTNPFLQGENERWQPIQTSFAAHLKYSFQFRPNTCADRIYGGAYQPLPSEIKNNLEILSHFMCFRGRGLPGLIPVFRSTTNGTSVCPPVGNRMIMIIIPIMVQSVRE